LTRFFIDIPPLLIRAICKQLKISNPPSLSDVETVTLWTLSGALASEIFDDTMTEEKTSKRTLKKLRWEMKEYLKELEDNDKV